MDSYFRNFGAHEMKSFIVGTRGINTEKLFVHRASVMEIGKSELAAGFATRLICSAWISAIHKELTSGDNCQGLIDLLNYIDMYGLEYSYPYCRMQESDQYMSILVEPDVLKCIKITQKVVCDAFKVRLQLSSIGNALLHYAWCAYSGKYRSLPLYGRWDSIPAKTFNLTQVKEPWYISWLDNNGIWQMETNFIILTPSKLPIKKGGFNRKVVKSSSVESARLVRNSHAYSSKGRDR